MGVDEAKSPEADSKDLHGGRPLQFPAQARQTRRRDLTSQAACSDRTIAVTRRSIQVQGRHEGPIGLVRRALWIVIQRVRWDRGP